MSVGLGLSFNACPSLFTTADVSVMPTCAEADWPSQATVRCGYLRATGWSWTERCSPIEGTYEGNSQTFTLDDLPDASDIRPVTYLGTRTVDRVGWTRLDGTPPGLTADNTTSFTVDRVDSLGGAAAFPKVLYIDQEAILCSAADAGTGIVTIAQRGYYGTTVDSHFATENPDYRPVVFGDFPSFFRRKVVFWIVENGVARPLWRGYVTSNPTSDGKELAYTFSCGPWWYLERMRALGVPNAGTQLRGFDALAIIPTATYQGSPPEISTGRLSLAVDRASWFSNTFEGACHIADQKFSLSLADHSIAASHDLYGDRNGSRFMFAIGMGLLPSPTVSLTVGTRIASGTTGDTVDPRSVTVRIAGSPTALYTPIPGQPVPLSRADGLPSVWVDPPCPDPTTTVRYVLRAQIAQGSYLVVEPDRPIELSALGPVAMGNVYIEGASPAGAGYRLGLGDSFHASSAIWIEDAVQFYLAAKIVSSHWLLALRYGVIENVGAVNGGIDANSWDWTFQSRVLDATQGGPNQRTLLLDGSHTLERLFKDTNRLAGIGIGTRASKMCLFPFQPPLHSDPVALTASADNIVDYPTWTSMPEGIVNQLSIGGASINVNVGDRRSSDLYGPSKPMELSMNGVDGYRGDATPDALARYAAQRVTGLWADPPASLVVACSIATLEQAYIGDYASITEHSAPVGDGTRALKDRRGQIIGRKITIPMKGAASVEFEILLYPQDGLAGYAPCARIAGIAIDVLTVDINYMPESLSATDYAASNLPSYKFVATSPHDGGTAHFEIDDAVELIEVDNAFPHAPETFLIIDVNPLTREITLDHPPSADWAAIIVGGGLVELVSIDYGAGFPNVTEHQASFCYVGSDVTELIDASADPDRRFAP